MTGVPEMRSEQELRKLTGVKWAKYGPDVLPAWVADMDLRPPDFAVQAVQQIADRADFGYNFAASANLPELFSAWQERHHGWEPDPGHVIVFNDVLHAIEVTIGLHTSPGSGIVLLTPIYPPFLRSLDGCRRALVDVPLDAGTWRLNRDRLRSAVNEETEAILLCSPHNPTGRVFDAEEREAIAEVVVEHDLVLISDEVWADLTHPGHKHVPMATVSSDLSARTVTISSASKTFSLAGLRCAAAHAGERLRSNFDELSAHYLGAVSSPGAEASAACWSQGDQWAEALRSFLTERRDQVLTRVAADLPGVKVHSPEATYLAWLDFSGTDFGPNPSRRLLEQGKVALSPGPDFGVHGQGFARMNFATSPQLVDEILDRIVDAFD